MLPNRNIPYTTQPQSNVAVNWLNPITQNLGLLNHPTLTKDLVTESKWEFGNNPVNTVNQYGLTKRFTTTSSQYGQYLNTNFPGSIGFSILLVCTVPSGNSNATLVSLNNIAQAQRAQIMVNNDALFISTNGSTVTSNVITIPYNSPLVIVGTWTNGSSSKIWQGTSTVTYTGFTAISTNLDTAVIAGRYSSGVLGGYSTYSQNFTGFWKRVLTDNEILSLLKNPWQIFRPLSAPAYSLFTKTTYPDLVPTLENPGFSDNKAKFSVSF